MLWLICLIINISNSLLNAYHIFQLNCGIEVQSTVLPLEIELSLTTPSILPIFIGLSIAGLLTLKHLLHISELKYVPLPEEEFYTHLLATSDLPWKGPLFTKEFYDFCLSIGYDIAQVNNFHYIILKYNEGLPGGLDNLLVGYDLNREIIISSYLRINQEHRYGLSSIVNLWWLSPRGAEYILSLKPIIKNIEDLEKCAQTSLRYTLNQLKTLRE